MEDKVFWEEERDSSAMSAPSGTTRRQSGGSQNPSQPFSEFRPCRRDGEFWREQIHDALSGAENFRELAADAGCDDGEPTDSNNTAEYEGI